MRYLLGLLLVFVYIYPLNFVFLPLPTRYMYTLLGIVLFFSGKFSISKSKYDTLTALGKCLLLLLTAAFFSCVANLNFDFYIINYVASFFISLFGAFSLIYLLGKVFGYTISKDKLITLVIYASVCQCVISLMFFLNPDIETVFGRICVSSELENSALSATSGQRFHGFGTNFFNAGISMSMALIFISFKLREERSRFIIFAYCLYVVFIVIVGSSMARTTQIGLALALFYFVCSKGNLNRNNGFILVVFLSFCVLGVITVIYLIETYQEFAANFLRAFSVIDTYINSGEIQGKESMTGKAIYPDNVMTWLIGDGLMADPRSPATAYYKHLDIGICRCLFYVGAVGTLMMYVAQYLYTKLIGFSKKETLLLFFLFVILQTKGMANIMTVFIAPFVIVNLFSVNKCNENKKESQASCCN